MEAHPASLHHQQQLSSARRRICHKGGPPGLCQS
ncbi:hypothetical protein RLOC_00007656 [Lonchura striata]|uniref:Uncharacterized protein n=1 Tax=Lonchura striata TaxID=40157 RepID=A0A218UFC2_9PASE|nr:hypothetical protein RLOC_00007656 [Lonchura striata domestica]